MTLFLLLLLPFAGSLVAGLLPANARNAEAWLAGGIALVGLVIVLLAYPTVANGHVLQWQVAWMPELGVNFGLRMDGFAWLFAFLVLAIGLLVVLYARYYMSPQDPVPRFFAFLLAFMGAMLGLVLSNNLIQLVMFWELTSLVSFMLIGYWHHNSEARRGARMALIITGTGGLALFAGVLMIGQVVGSYQLDDVLAAGSAIRDHPWYLTILILVLLGAFTKSAQFPFHFWLPRAMAAPTPVSAYLHSATMVKAGVFLMARLWPVLAGTSEWAWLVGGVGLITLLLGAYTAMFQQDLKGLLAYSTISQLGLITMLLGLNSALGVVAAVFHIFNHAIFKASLFMAAGVIDHETGTRDLRRLGGLYRAMPITATLAMVASAAMAGVPLLNGFLSKEMFFAEAVAVHGNDWVQFAIPALATLAGVFGVTYSLRFIVDVFFGPQPADLPREPHEPPRWMRAPIEWLVVACLVIGIVPGLTVQSMLEVAAAPVFGAELPSFTLSVWHGFNLPLLMSVIALIGGWLLFKALHRYLKIGTLDYVPLIYRLDGRSTFEAALNWLGGSAEALLRVLDTRRLQPQLLWLIGMALFVGGYPFLVRPLQMGSVPITPIEPAFVLLWLVGAACALGAAWQARFHRLAALMLMGGAGLITCITFVWFSAPDLALTQLMVEVVTMVLILLGLRWLPILRRDAEIGAGVARRVTRRMRDLLMAILAGVGMTVLAYAILTRDFPQSISPYFLARAESEGGGTNVVNVILVDFRGFDTMGEITVLAIVALAVFALLRRFRPAPESLEIPLQQQTFLIDKAAVPAPGEDAAQPSYLRVAAVLARLLLPILLLVGIYMLLRGHNLPGGGFVAGLITAVAFILQYMVGGTLWVEKNLRLPPLRWMGTGLLLAGGTGIGAWFFGYPFLTSHTAHPVLPILGEVPLASALFFDLGVFAVVVGSTLLTLTALAHQSVRAQRAVAVAAEAEAAPRGMEA
ncbi:MAG: monovalent cation/H+ antiporter subunit A [Pigmentiphaga sp.]|nr:monovalent cation/H+ antiporter subunit A [Pigmentiphaga sp.]